ncbi:YjfB family protein [Hydrogenovibrio sp. 3SP14C1]|uniref:YjfB family protein n=1 Tax=Hydrogenovibrio sp. 3SP14C1 TaxID=3038774 RepID=UPI0024170E74|nr:YjfB family protein [Hydrogenovibrio sp. 3SP14C1]MDG4813583.1 YjfB family protein [Hydrogenovibrio sp. 3SP14C1]
MDISSNTAVYTYQQHPVNTHQQVQVSMLKKAMDMQAEGALALIQSLPNASSAQALPANLGNHINTTA